MSRDEVQTPIGPVSNQVVTHRLLSSSYRDILTILQDFSVIDSGNYL
jgi:hypothetical protein